MLDLPNVVHLERRYIDKELSIEEMREYLSILENANYDEYRDQRIKNLKTLIQRHEKSILAKEKEEKAQYDAAVGYRDLTIKWESYGAYWRPLGTSLTQWYYKDNCFFTWLSGVDAVAHFESAKLADIEFERLVNDNQASR